MQRNEFGSRNGSFSRQELPNDHYRVAFHAKDIKIDEKELKRTFLKHFR